jgi:hypothetical protein
VWELAAGRRERGRHVALPARHRVPRRLLDQIAPPPRNGIPVGKKFLVKDDDGDGPDVDPPPPPPPATPPATADFPGFVRWSNDADPLVDVDASPAPDVEITGAGVGAVIVLSSRQRFAPCGSNPCFSLLGPTATAQEICNQGDTSCFDVTLSGTTQDIRGGLSYIAGYNPAADSTATDQPPAVQKVFLEPGPGVTGCRAGPFVYSDAVAGCTIRLVADIKFPSGSLPAGRALTDVLFTAYDALGWCGSGCTLAHVGGTTWAATITTDDLPVTDTDGRNAIRLRWRMATGPNIAGADCHNSNPGAGGNPCDGGFDANGMGYVGAYDDATLSGPVHRGFSSNELLSGPIEVVRVFDAGLTPPQQANAYPRNDTPARPDLFVDVFLSSVVATDADDPPIALRVTGSQNGTIDCDAAFTFPQEFALGCRPRYIKNPFTTNPPCPDYNDLWNTAQPWTCVKTQTGVSLGNVRKGLQDRVLEGGNSCVPDNDLDPNNFRAGWNYWNNGLGSAHPNAGTMFPNFEPTDPRLVTLFITPFGSFQGSGNAIFPISGFGAFYITGWSVTGGDQDPCPGNDVAPEKFLMGHFIKDVLISGATPSQNKCNPASLTPCVVALVE